MTRLHGLPLCVLLFGCNADHSVSSLHASREARYLLHSPDELPSEFWREMDDVHHAEDFLQQRQAGWSFWNYMLRVLPGSPSRHFMRWQTWYGREDLQRIFRYLYERLDATGRRQRQPFTTEEIQKAIHWNNHQQFHEAGWSMERFEKWLAAFDTLEKQYSIPGMEKILFNPEVMQFMLQNYRHLEICQKQRQRNELCDALIWPERAVFIKTSWRRSEHGFLVDHFPADAASLSRQWQNPEWIAEERMEPEGEASFSLRLPTGQKFHLTGLHASLRLKEQWFWTSLWLGREVSEDLAADQPEDWTRPWTHYRLCSVDGWQEPLRTQVPEPDWPEPIADFTRVLVAHELYNWCSNPYLEPGPNNHKTNCIGCHQHAGLNWTQQDFRQRLTQDFWSLIHQTGTPGPADYVWSLYMGPEPLIQPLMDTIEFFDVYDPYQ